MADGMNKGFGSMNVAPRVRRVAWRALAGVVAAVASVGAQAESCPVDKVTGLPGRELKADIVAFDQPIMYNRLGASRRVPARPRAPPVSP